MTDTLTVTVSEKTVEMPKTVQTVAEFLETAGFDSDTHDLYRSGGGKIDGEPFVFDDGDEFAAVLTVTGDA